MDEREKAKSTLIFNRVLGAIVGPFLVDGNRGEMTRNDMKDMSMEDLTAFILFLKTIQKKIQ